MSFKRGINPIEKMNVGHTHNTIKINKIWFQRVSGQMTAPEDCELVLDRLHKVCNTNEVIPLHELNLYFIKGKADYHNVFSMGGKKILYKGYVFKIPNIWGI